MTTFSIDIEVERKKLIFIEIVILSGVSCSMIARDSVLYADQP